MTETFKIEQGVPLPKMGKIRQKYPYRRLKPGESFLVACGENERERMMNSLNSGAHWAGYKTGFKFAMRTVLGGIRVWRTQ